MKDLNNKNNIMKTKPTTQEILKYLVAMVIMSLGLALLVFAILDQTIVFEL